MTGLTISVEENPLPADLNVIENALVLHNEAKSTPRNYTSLTIFLHNAEGKIGWWIARDFPKGHSRYFLRKVFG